ncbi:MAG: class II aldolase [Planctomycetes bacterium]|nr:class II aldolase [Planctomycetota bacterium]
MNNTLRELIRISNTVGRNAALVLGAFGNTSLKTADGRFMVIKASGTCLKDMNTRSGWRKLNVDEVKGILEHPSRKDANAALLSACCDKKPASVRPSIESFFHAILDACVIHLHPESVLALACAKDGKKHMEKLFSKKKNPPLWIPYVGLGYVSAQKIRSLAGRYEKTCGQRPRVFIMQNHGLLVSAPTSAAAMRLVRQVVGTCQKNLPHLKPVKIKPAGAKAVRGAAEDIRMAISGVSQHEMAVSCFNDKTIAAFLKLPNAKQLCSGGPITNDEAAITGSAPMWLETTEPKALRRKLQRLAEKDKHPPKGFAVKGVGLFIASENNDADFLADLLRSAMNIRAVASKLGGPRAIPKKLLALYAEPLQ